jgi:hypothetical protein
MAKNQTQQTKLDIDDRGQIAFGFVLVDEAGPGPARLAEIGVTGYQDLFHRLIEQGWRWQKAAFMAWRAAPRNSRQPETQEELARLLGYAGDKVFRVWLNKPEQGPLMEAIIRQAAAEVLQAHLADVDLVTIRQATAAESSIGERELFYKRYREAVGPVADRGREDDELEKMSDEELEAELARLAEVNGGLENGDYGKEEAEKADVR